MPNWTSLGSASSGGWAAATSSQRTSPVARSMMPMRPRFGEKSPTFVRTSRDSVYPDSVIQTGIRVRRDRAAGVMAVEMTA
jgi:hypothetical protein